MGSLQLCEVFSGVTVLRRTAVERQMCDWCTAYWSQLRSTALPTKTGGEPVTLSCIAASWELQHIQGVWVLHSMFFFAFHTVILKIIFFLLTLLSWSANPPRCRLNFFERCCFFIGLFSVYWAMFSELICFAKLLNRATLNKDVRARIRCIDQNKY